MDNLQLPSTSDLLRGMSSVLLYAKMIWLSDIWEVGAAAACDTAGQPVYVYGRQAVTRHQEPLGWHELHVADCVQ